MKSPLLCFEQLQRLTFLLSLCMVVGVRSFTSPPRQVLPSLSSKSIIDYDTVSYRSDRCIVMKLNFWDNDVTAKTKTTEEGVANSDQTNIDTIKNMSPAITEDSVKDQLSEILLYRLEKSKNKSNKKQTENSPYATEKKDESEVTRYPFVIDQIEPKSEPQKYRDAAQVCVEVFFNSNDEVLGIAGGILGGKNSMSPFKAMQLAYLRNMQYGDLRGRTFLSNAQNSMLVARQVVPLTSSGDDDDVITDLSTIYNSDCLEDDVARYTRGDYLGFVEVTERSFGLGKKFDEVEGENEEKTDKEGFVYEEVTDGVSKKNKKPKQPKLRPLLTNLSVRSDARQSGIGSALLETAESSVLTWDKPKYSEVILQVEDDNPNAIAFYEKRGYTAIFADPACRRFATDGLMLRKERCTKIAMRKELAMERAKAEDNKVKKEGGIGDIFRKLPFF